MGGGLDDGSENAPLASKLAQHFTVYNYQRRGRGGSGDTPPYAVEREVEDIAALIARAGGTADLYGVSSGGALVLEAAHAGVAASKLAVYEVPYDTAPDTAEKQRDYRDKLTALLAADRRDEALELFMRLAGSRGARAGAETLFRRITPGLAEPVTQSWSTFSDGDDHASRNGEKQ